MLGKGSNSGWIPTGDESRKERQKTQKTATAWCTQDSDSSMMRAFPIDGTCIGGV